MLQGNAAMRTLLVNKADYPEGFYSVTFRFWAPRGQNTVVCIDSFDGGGSARAAGLLQRSSTFGLIALCISC